MPGLDAIGKLLLLVGAVILVLGGVLVVLSRFTPLGRLPGDIVIQRDSVTMYFPLVTMVLLSILLTVLLNIIIRFLNR
ncbi:MAG: DUF2905 domain-containing protein [Chloroflexi bacterium]|nr:DUF2905 domain-containing protein [Chloroflexota bacterium]